MAVRIRNEFYSDNNTRYKVEILDTDWVGSVDTAPSIDKAEIDYDGDENDPLDVIHSSTCSVIISDNGDSTFNAFKADIADANESQFQLVLYRHNGSGWDLYWVGVIMTDMCGYRNENAPREFEILAKDGLSRLELLKFTEINSGPFTTEEQTFIYIIKTILSKNGLSSLFTGDYIKVSIDWNEVSQTLPAPQRILEYVELWGDLLRVQSGDNYEKKSGEEPLDCKKVLEALLRLFCARISHSEGCYHIQQVSNFTSDTYDEVVYDNTGTYDSLNTSVSIKQTESKGGDFEVMSDGQYTHTAAIRSSRLTAKGYRDIRGAYIDEVIVNEDSKVYNQTMKLGTILGGGQSFATATILAAHNSLGADIVLIAEKIGSSGNSISFTTATGADLLFKQVNDYNDTYPDYRIKVQNPNQLTAQITTANTYNFTGGATGTGSANRQIEIDFELTNYSQISDAMASNMQLRIDIKLICGSYRIKNHQANNIEVDWSTTSTDKWSYLIKGDVYTANKFSLLTPEIPFESENNCTLELTVTLQRVSTSVAFPNSNDYGGIFHDFRVIAWDSSKTLLGDQLVRVENPDNAFNSMEYDFGDIIIGDDPVVQSSISSKNYLIVDDGSSVYYRSNVWNAGFDTNYNLTHTMLMEAMALRRKPIEKYIGSFTGTYEFWKSIGYDSGRWVVARARYDLKMDSWSGTWWKINYSRADITLSEERLLPPPIGLRPYKKQLVIKNDFPVNSKGKSVYPYVQGMGVINAVETGALDNDLFKEGDSVMVFHPSKGDLLDTFVVDSDTTVSDTSISIVGATMASEIPVGALLEHNSKEVVATAKLRADKNFTMKSRWVNVNSLDETDFTGTDYQLTVEQEYVIFDLPSGTYNVYFPLVDDSLIHGKSIILTIKCTTNFLTIYPHTADTGARIVTNGDLTSLIISGGQNISFVCDGTDWHRIGL